MKIENRTTQNIVITIICITTAASIFATSSWPECVGWIVFLILLYFAQQGNKAALKNEVQR